MHVLTDPADCGPVTLALLQDLQTEACDDPEGCFRERSLRRTASPAPRALSSSAIL
jgi:3D-(3,5/4)-trihydroxycyclohexane-1,2-dione acylhydrolase (decyclizing)